MKKLNRFLINRRNAYPLFCFIITSENALGKEAQDVPSKRILSKATSGAMAGIVGGMALASSFMGIDSQLGVPSGTFYKMIGLLVDLKGIDAIVFGFCVHISTAALIGSVFFVCSTFHRTLHISSFQKGVFAGGVTGLEVFAIFFLPINLFIMIPAVEQVTMNPAQYGLTLDDIQPIKQLLSNTDGILWGSLYLHLLYGVVMGFFAGAMLPHEYPTMPRKDSYQR